MPGVAAARSPIPHLSLVPAPAAGRPRMARRRPRVSLAGSPYRPGELPSALQITLADETAQEASRRARALQIPVELSIRAHVDAARAATWVVRATGWERPAIHDMLRREAHALDSAPTTGVDLLDYTRLVRQGEAASVTRAPSGRPLELLLPADLALAWRSDAAARGEALAEWVTSMLDLAPNDAPNWEAAAASRGLRLAEWAYACALERIAVSSTSPQSRT